MTKNIKVLKLAAILTLLPGVAIMAPQAFAAETQWSTETVNVDYTRSERRYFRKGDQSTMDVLTYTSGDRSGSVEFVCFKDQLYAGMIFDNAEPSFTDTLTQESSGYQTVPRPIQFGAKKYSVENFLPSQTGGTYIVFKKNMVNKFYNAAIRGETIKFNPKSNDGVMVSMPKPNQAFANFASSCGMVK